MRLLTRYVLWEVTLIFTVTLTVLTTLILVVGVAAEAYRQSLGLVHILRLLPYLLPNALLFAVPGTMLFAVSTVYGRMAAAGEVVAVKSLGLSPMVLLWPALLLSIALSFVTVWLNDLACSWGHQGAQRVVIDAVEDIAYSVLRTQRSYSTKSFSVNVKSVEGRRLILPTFTFQSSGDSPAVTITAREAELRSNTGSGVLSIICRDGSFNAGEVRFDFPDTFEREISLVDATRKGDLAEKPAHMPLSILPERIALQRIKIDRAQQTMAATAGYAMLTGDFAQLSGPTMAAAARSIDDETSELYRMQTEPPRRWANGFSCLCFALVGSCMAIRLKNADVWTSFFLCFGPILLIYYPLMAFGLDRSKAGAVPAYTVWLANAIVMAWGLWMRRKVVRY